MSRRPRFVPFGCSKDVTDCGEYCDRNLPICNECSIKRLASFCFYRQQRLDLVLQEGLRRAPKRRNAQSQSKSLISDPKVPQEMTLRTCRLPISSLNSQTGDFYFAILLQHGACYQFLPPVLPYASESLSSSIKAVSLQCLSLARNEHRLMIKARETFAEAVQATDRRVSCLPPDIILDDLVATISMLGLFSIMSSNASVVRDVWTTHIDGIAAVMRNQYTHQIPRTGLLMMNEEILLYAIRCIHLSHLQRRRKLPADLYGLYLSSPASSIHGRTHAIVNVIAFLPRSHWKVSVDYKFRLMRLASADNDALKILEYLKSIQPYELKPPDGDGKPVCHQYLSPSHAQQWNFYRVVRLLVNQEMASFLLEDLEQVLISKRELNVSRVHSTISSLLFDISASVPHCLRDSSTDLISMNAETIHWAHSLIWPLAQAQASPYISVALFSFVNDTLERLCRTTGFPGSFSPRQQQDGGLALKDWYVIVRSCVYLLIIIRAHVLFWR